MRFTPWLLMALCVGSLGPVAAVRAADGDPLAGLEKLKTYRTQRSSSTDREPTGNNDFRSIPPGQTLVIADLKGPGAITHIWNTVNARERGYSRLLRLRMYWDGEAEPSVDCPLGDFFAVGHGVDAPVASTPVQVSSSGRARNCYWPMPFRRSARVTVTNEGREPVDSFYFYVDWHQDEKPDRDAAYFHAQYRQEHPTPLGSNYLVADITGRGHYVGTVLSVRSHESGWWGEGDDLFFVDGDREPTLHGTGSEDYFCDAWGVFPHMGSYYGTTLWEGNEAVGARTTVYKWHIPDPVAFRTSLRFELEHKGVAWNPDGSVKSYFGDRIDDLSSVAFWYQTEPHKPFPPMPAGYARLYVDPRDMLQGERLIEGAAPSAGGVERQEMSALSGGAQLFWKPESAGQTLSVPLEVKEAGAYDLLVQLTRSWDYGIYQVELDGQPLGEPVDLHSAALSSREVLSFNRKLASGRHMLRFVNKGRNEKSVGYYLGLDGLLLTRNP